MTKDEMEAIIEAAEDIDIRNRGPAHLEYCDWESADGTECVCGMNELRAALAAGKE